VQPAQLAGGDGVVGGLVGDVEAPLVADLHRDVRGLNLLEDLGALGEGAGQRLLTEHREPGVDRGHDELGVGVGPGGDDDAVQARFEQGVGRDGRFRPKAVGDLPGQGGDQVGDDQGVDHR
jgi:hypothetical protein